MGTRSIIIITGKEKSQFSEMRASTRLYKHYDGYPTNVLANLAEAFIGWRNWEGSICHDSAIEAILAKEMGAKVEAKFEGEFNARRTRRLGNQGDLEWIYVVNTDTRHIEIYGGGYTDKTPSEVYRLGTVSPYILLDGIKDEYLDGLYNEIKKAIADLKKIGFTVNARGL